MLSLKFSNPFALVRDTRPSFPHSSHQNLSRAGLEYLVVAGFPHLGPRATAAFARLRRRASLWSFEA